ncbi:hypothetical protein Q4543_24325 [Salipiger sp. 1_MG-2023]|uniref:hypothetical protein n=1 Tax=Salipiger sp. 1_MG-2023 TaxID=3062665 RepID=UPI0026E44CAA|nr:hypothetical protein [Salipiger sp. 1_MG-2023]MDO6588573.1 hypothetical protein [Salipiger sp. 1_MG-2023]
MATFALITPSGGAEPCAHFAPSLVSRGFTRLNSALARYIDCERDLDGVHCFDPAFLDGMVDAEAARSTVLDCITMITDAPIARESDKPLQRSAVLTRALIDSDKGAEFTGLYQLLGSHPSFFAARTTM